MLSCNNCGSTLSCGCQKKIASDGASVCQNCITAYEEMLRQLRLLQSLNSNTNHEKLPGQ